MQDNESTNNTDNNPETNIPEFIYLNPDDPLPDKKAAPSSNNKKNKKEKKKEAPAPIIIKKVKKSGGDSHGGSWKIAYADFVTAMMAFFLLMWLLAALNKAQKEGIADYFKQPLKIALFAGKEMGDRSENVQGGGPDVLQKDGQVAAKNPEKSVADKEQAQAEELKQLQNLQAKLQENMNSDPALASLKKQILMEITKDGLRIQLIDDQKNPMFALGEDKVNPAMENILTKLTQLLKNMPNKISIQGHTDAYPYDKPEELKISNWELSTQRANSARRILTEAGLSDNKILRVTGFADNVPLDKKNPLNPVNRRITIIVMKKEAENILLNSE